VGGNSGFGGSLISVGFALVLLSVVVGAITQRVAGMGFGLVVTPALVLLLGPYDGVVVVNLGGALVAGILIFRVWGDIDWRRYAGLAVAAIVAIIPGSVLALVLPEAALEVTIGALIIVGVIVSIRVGQTTPASHGGALLIAAGATSGLMGTLAGVSGPPIGVYAIATRWPHRTFAATTQPYFLTVSIAALVTKQVISGDQPSALDPWQWAAIIGAVVLALAASEVFYRRIPERWARRAVIGLALLGGVATLIHGAIQLRS
jgi:uncharacterized protein